MILAGRYNHDALIALGATTVRDLKDGNTEVFPDGLNVSGYAVTLLQISALTLDAEANGALDSDKIMRLLFEINYDQENRLRTFGGQPQITKLQYRNAIISAYKAL